jgi:opacity protein-like surface antigen
MEKGSMFAQSKLAAALLFYFITPGLAYGQQETNGIQRPRFIVFANGGGSSALTDLNDAGTASLETGWTAGGGVGFQLNQYMALRGTFDFAQADGEGTSALSGQSLNRYFYGGDVQLRYPTASGIAPYVILGAGAVTIDNPDNVAFDRFTKFAPRSNIGFFAQGSSYVYDFDRNGFDKTQVDLLWTAGLSYRISY